MTWKYDGSGSDGDDKYIILFELDGGDVDDLVEA